MEFIESTHQYINDEGIIIPSVSELIRNYIGNEYTNVSKEILDRAAKHGTMIHEAIERYETSHNYDIEGYNEDETKALEFFREIKEKENIYIADMERIVYTKDYAGRFDIFGQVNKQQAFIDIKTNSNYPKEHLELQLGLYIYAWKQMLKTDNEYKAYCIWLPRNKKPKFEEVKPCDEETVKEIIAKWQSR